MTMSGKLSIITVFAMLFVTNLLMAQTKSAFSGEIASFRTELTSFMGPNLKPEQNASLTRFLARWDSAAFSTADMGRIVEIAGQLSSKSFRPVPHFNEFIQTINYFADNKKEGTPISTWLKGVSGLAFSPRLTSDNILRLLRNTGLLVRSDMLFESGSVRWKVKSSQIKFGYDTIFHVDIKDAILTCISRNDSTNIYDATGMYYPEYQLFTGNNGIVTWEKAGYARKDVSAALNFYKIDVSKNSFSADSVRLTHTNYFTKPELGQLSDQAVSFQNKEKANYPRFSSYAKEFKIRNVFRGVNYEGGLSFEGASVKGTGERYSPAEIKLYRNDTLYLKINSKEFLISKTGLNSQEVSVSLYIGKDSIYHSNLGFSYIDATRQVNLFRTSNPVSKSPYFNSFHGLDMYFEYLSWNMNESRIILSRSRGSSLGRAQFESVSYFDGDDFLQLMGLDNYHPLNRLLKFAEWYYSETFPVTEFAKWLNKPEEAVIGLCMDLANKGFVFYDRTNNEITIKKKTKDYLDSYARKKDYDVLNIFSETKAPVDNAILNLGDYEMTVNGVTGVLLSDSQKVAIYPYNKQLIIGKNRRIWFDGVVDAGLFSIYGHKFSFSYDTFNIRLQKIDSIKLAVETGENDLYGRPVTKKIDNLIQLGTAELLIDKPDNKSGLKSFRQYPIINASTYSYIFFDKIPGLEDIYKQKEFYFRIDPFNYENIDHFSVDVMNLTGEFTGGNILKPMRQYLRILEDNSLGFSMIIPKEGIEMYGSKARLFDTIRMSNKGLIGSGTLKRLTSTTISGEYKFFPDSMLTHATSFNIEKDSAGLFPFLNSQNVDIKWLTLKDEWNAVRTDGKKFDMFNNGTTLDGTITLSPAKLYGNGVIEMTDSRITSNQFSFTSGALRADTAVYNLKSLTTGGYTFIAENANTSINFDLQTSNFHLNTDSSVVKFPEIQYICTMTDFMYDMKTRVLRMEQKGKSNTPLLTSDKLVRLSFSNLDKPTFFATNNLSDTISFSSWKGSYHLDQEYIEAENINYIHVADALIQPKNGKIIISKRAQIQPLDSAIIALNNRHVLHTAKINIESTKRYSGSAVYDYLTEGDTIQHISFPELTVDTLTTSAIGYIPATQQFRLNPAFTFAGDVMLSARNDQLTFNGAAGIIHNCSGLQSYTLKFKSKIDPGNVMIPVQDKGRDINDNLVFSGSFINIDSTHIYPAFLSPQKSWSDVGMVNATGFLYFDKARGRYIITSLEKLADPKRAGNMVSFDKNYCIIASEGTLNFGTKLDLVTLAGAGNVTHYLDSGKVHTEAILGLDFYFSAEALRMMAEEIRLIPSLRSVNLNSELNNKGMRDLLGADAASQLKEEINLFGTSRNLPRTFNYELLLNDVKLYWNESTSSFISRGKIGIGFIGPQPINVYVDGYVEIQRRRSGDMIDIYLKADRSTWYYFSYFKGVMMTESSNIAYNTLIADTKLNDRKHPDSNVRVPYTYMISVENRVERFLSRMAGDTGIEEEPLNP